VNHVRDLAVVERAAARLKPDGALWIFHPKGRGATPTDAQVRAAGIAAGLVDNKISAYTDTHTATRYLTPSGTPLEFWEHDYAAGSSIIGGHCFPGGSDIGPSPFQFGCADLNTFVVGKQAMQFFLAHPMP